MIAFEERHDVGLRPQQQVAGAWHAAELCTGRAEQVGANLIEGDTELADRLARVNVQECAMGTGRHPDLKGWLHRTDLMVGMLDMDHEGVRAYRLGNGIRVERARSVDAYDIDLKTVVAS